MCVLTLDRKLDTEQLEKALVDFDSVSLSYLCRLMPNREETGKMITTDFAAFQWTGEGSSL